MKFYRNDNYSGKKLKKSWLYVSVNKTDVLSVALIILLVWLRNLFQIWLFSACSNENFVYHEQKTMEMQNITIKNCFYSFILTILRMFIEKFITYFSHRFNSLTFHIYWQVLDTILILLFYYSNENNSTIKIFNPYLSFWEEKRIHSLSQFAAVVEFFRIYLVSFII